MMKVYVAGASSEMERAERMMAALRAEGIEVVSSWPEVIRKVGSANPMEAPRDDRARWAATDLFEVASSTVFWLLLPEKASEGASTEYGYALFLGSSAMKAREMGIDAPVYRIIASGKERSIFTALADLFESDKLAFDALVLQSKLERSVDQASDTEH